MMTEIVENRIFNFLEKHNINNKTVVVGVSGGADSIALLLALTNVAKKNKLKIKVFHINHKLRSFESEKDQVFCQNFCSLLNVECEVFAVDVEKYAKENKLSIETAARDLRRETFFKHAQKSQIKYVFLAHTYDDQVETLLFRIARGTGIHGLSGIADFSNLNEIGVCRPLLSIKKQQLISYLKKNNIKWREDLSNYELNYTRNKIRHNIIPEFKKVFGNAFEKSLTRLGSISHSFLESFNDLIPMEYKQLFIIYPKTVIIDLDKIEVLRNLVIFAELLRVAFIKAGFYENLPDINTVEKIYDLCFNKGNKKIFSNKIIYCVKDRGFVVIQHSPRLKSMFSCEIRTDNKKSYTNLDFEEASYELYHNILSGKIVKLTYAFKSSILVKKLKCRYLKNEEELNSVKLGTKTLKNIFSNKRTPYLLIYQLPLVYNDQKLILIPGIVGAEGVIQECGQSLQFTIKPKITIIDLN